ncbi:MAG: hypothetical protein IRZ16_22365 [Myxococcaceae bacterium]|nr:hypothetical protein [Myxococcaceae bacterium]
MNRRWLVPGLFAAALSLGACSPKYHVISNESESPVLPTDCAIRILSAAPDEAFTVIGRVEPDEPGKLTADDQTFLEAIKPQACTRTANAVIVVRDDARQITRATLIRIR